MSKDKKALQNNSQGKEMPGLILWPIFAILMTAGLSALIYFPAQVGYGLAATILFRVIVGGILIFVSWRFVRAIREIDKLNKIGGG